MLDLSSICAMLHRIRLITPLRKGGHKKAKAPGKGSSRCLPFSRTTSKWATELVPLFYILRVLCTRFVSCFCCVTMVYTWLWCRNEEVLRRLKWARQDLQKTSLGAEYRIMWGLQPPPNITLEGHQTSWFHNLVYNLTGLMSLE